MIRHLEHTAIDKKRWDECISKASNSCMFAYSWYLDIVSPGWTALVKGDYESVFPMAQRSKFRIRYIHQPFFTRYFGVFSEESSPVADPFLDAIPAEYKYMEFCLHEDNKAEAKGFLKKERRYQLLELSPLIAELQSAYSDNAKRSIKKAQKAGFIVQNEAAPETVVELFRRTKGNELDEFRAEDYETLARLMQAFRQRDGAETFSVYDPSGALCAAAFFMRSGNRFVFLKSGVTAEGRASGAMHLLMDAFIRKHAGSAVLLDFGGSSVETVARFYRNFGAKDCVYLQVKKDRLSRLARLIRSLKS